MASNDPTQDGPTHTALSSTNNIDTSQSKKVDLFGCDKKGENHSEQKFSVRRMQE